MFWQTTMAISRCAPDGTVYREGCPREVLVTSRCRDCQITGWPLVDYCEVRKNETKTIEWANAYNETEELRGTGVNGYNYYCDRPARINPCWPVFMPPTVTSQSWSQVIIDQTCSWNTFNCGRSCGPCADGQSRTESSSGSCSSGGGGGGGGGGDEEPGGGCTNCNCYYQTTYQWVNLEDGCGDKYQQVNYVCDGVVVTEGSWEYLGWSCDYYY